MEKYGVTGLLCVLLTIQAQAQLSNQGSAVIISSGASVQILGNVTNANGGSLTVGGTLGTSANLTNTGGATLQGNGQYIVGGNWTNDAAFDAGTSTVTFDGDQNSMITSGGAAFYDVALNKTGGNDLLLAGNMTVTNSLDFQASGNYAVLGEYNLQVGDITGYDAARHVRTTGAGFLVRTVGGTPVVFPVGNTSYNPATLTNAGASDQYRVRVANDVLGGGYTGNAYLADAVDRGWFVEEENPGGSDLTLALQWNDNEELPGFDRSMAYVSHFDAGTWDSQPTAAADGAGPYSLSRTGITALSPFAVLGGNFQPTVDILGQIRWRGDGFTGVKDATVTASGDLNGLTTTDINGNYTLTLAGNGDVSLVPSKIINLLNGVNVGDAVAIQQHLVGISVITDFFRLVAADCNNSFTISTVDAAIIRQALLGNPAAVAILTATGAWRFISTDYPYPNPSPPYTLPNYAPYKTRSVTVTTSNLPGQDFWGIKTGDVVATFANPANFGGSGGMQPLVFRVQDRILEAGQELDVTFSSDHFANLAALQFGLHFDPDYLELKDVQPLTALPLDADNFGLYGVQDGAIQAVWSQPEGLELPGGSELFRLRFSALRSGVRLSEVLDMKENILPGLAFNSTLQQAPVELRYTAATATGAPAETATTLEAWPNPYVHTTSLRFNLPEACQARLRVLDESGRELWRLNKNYPAGQQQEPLHLPGVVGALVCELTTPLGISILKIVGVGNLD